MKVYKSRKRFLRKNSRSKNRRNKTKSRKIYKQYGGNLNEQQIQRIQTTLRPILSSEELTQYTALFNRISSYFSSKFNEYFDALDEIIDDKNYTELRTLMEDNNEPKESTTKLIQSLKHSTFINYNNMVIEIFKQLTENNESKTDMDSDDAGTDDD